MPREPYLSVVVTTRNDDHGGDPLKRLQAFVNSFDEQCRRTGLDAEVIVVEWNPPFDRPRVSSLLRLPTPPTCAYRFIDAPPELHQQLRFADVLPMFQMIAKNVGIRRALGRFVLATNIDILFTNELVEYLASGQLEPGCMYRVDRHDIESAVPLDAPLDAMMAYCANHQLRIHASWGSFSVDPQGHRVALPEDIVDGRSVVLGSGWHVREDASPTGSYRWATDCAKVHIDLPADPSLARDTALEIEFAANPYEPARSTEIDIVDDAGALLMRASIARRRVLRIPLQEGAQRRTLELRVVGVRPSCDRRQAGMFERRGALHYVVRSIKVTSIDMARSPEPFAYPSSGWRPIANVTVQQQPDGDQLSVVSCPARWSYCLEYGPLRAAETGTYQFAVTADIFDGAIALGVLYRDRKAWMAASVAELTTPQGHILTAAISVKSGERFFLMLSNDHPIGDRSSRFLVKELRGSVPASKLMRQPTGKEARRVQPQLLEQPQPLAPSRVATVCRALLARSEQRKLVRQSQAQQSLQFPMSGWRRGNQSPALEVEHRDDGVFVGTESRKWSYCVEYGPQWAPATGTYTFVLSSEVVEGGVSFGVLSADRQRWLPSISNETIAGNLRTLAVTVRLRAGQSYWLMLFNDHPAGDGVSRIVVRDLTATVEIRDVWEAIRSVDRARWPTAAGEWIVQQLASIARGASAMARRAVVSVVTAGVRVISSLASPARAALMETRDRVRRRIVYSAPEYAAAEQAYRTLEHRVAQLAPLGELEHVYKLLQDRRPDPLHLNGCGDFQLMAREHWFELRGYPEFQTFSMNIDALLSSVACYAGVRERVLESPLHIYHVEHEVGSGWTPEGEAALRRRIGERGITWLDSRDVFLWSAYMHWLNRPMIFNASNWGSGALQLEETVVPQCSPV